MPTYTEQQILTELDLAFNDQISEYFPQGDPQDIRYNFAFDLEHGYFVTAGSRIHLYGDNSRWTIVCEKNGYQNRGGNAEIELNYFGNCIHYPVASYPDRNYITNAANIELIGFGDYEAVTSEDDFERISATAEYILVKGKPVPLEHDAAKYEELGIELGEYDNPNGLIGYADLIRYLHEVQPDLISATEENIKAHLPADLPKLAQIDNFHFESVYKKETPPSQQETYQLLATVLVSQDPGKWQPTKEPNNHWSNWESGTL